MTHKLFLSLILTCVMTGFSKLVLAGAGTVLINEDFEDGKADNFTEVSGTDPRTGITIGDSVGAGQRAFTIYYPGDETSGYLWKYPVSYDSIELSFAQKLPDRIPINNPGGRGWVALKQSRLFEYTGKHGSNFYHELQYYRPGWEAGSPAMWKQVLYVENSGEEFFLSPAFDPTKWHHQKYWLKLNTPGNKDGKLMYWFDGKLLVNVSNISISDTVAARPNGFWFGGNFSYGGGQPDFAFRRLIDDLKVVINGDVPSPENPLTIASVAKQTILEDGAATAIPIKVSRSTGLNGAVKVTATSSSLAIIPAAGLSVAGSGADWKITAKPAANKHGTSTIRVQAQDGVGSGVTTFDVVVKAVADTPSITPASTTKNVPTTCGLVVTRSRLDGAEVTHFKISNIANGQLTLADGRTVVTNGSFLTFAQANAGLRFRPAVGFTGTATFDVRASVSASDAGLGGGIAKGQILVTP